MTDIKTKCVEELQSVLSAVEKAMKDIQAGNYDDAALVLDELKSGYQESKQEKQKAS